MTSRRAEHGAAALPDGRVLVAGGDPSVVDCENTLSSAEIFDPPTGTWTATPDTGQPRSEGSLTLLNDGRVPYSGGNIARAPQPGYCGDFAVKAAELFDPSTGQWSVFGGAASTDSASGGSPFRRSIY